MSVNVEGIDRVELLKGLWEGSQLASFYFYCAKEEDIPNNFNLELAKKCQEKNVNIDYFCGRPIKAKVFTKKTEIDSQYYDRYNGEGKFQSIVDALRK